LALPQNLPAKPTFVESDHCGSFLVTGGVSLITSTPQDCEIQVTLANGDVLTTTATFKALPNCCTPGLTFASASPFKTLKAGARDAAAQDDAQDVLLSNEWWYPECGTPANNCPETCGPVQLSTAPTACGPYERHMVGCVPRGRIVSGWFCLMRTSDHELVYTEEAPANPADFEPCPPELANVPIVPATCPDAAAP
jgi:hypothetical protein